MQSGNAIEPEDDRLAPLLRGDALEGQRWAHPDGLEGVAYVDEGKTVISTECDSNGSKITV